jgi:hypothetical protein
MLQNLLVILIVLIAALYALWRWALPPTWRRGAARRLAASAESAGLANEEQARRMAASLAQSPGCGACAQCAPHCASGRAAGGE